MNGLRAIKENFMNYNLRTLFEELMTTDTLDMIEKDYNKYKDVSLTNLGVDSLSSVELILRLEDIYEVSIDYETIDMKDFETLNKLNSYISTLNAYSSGR
jgi:acyl carrier protein